MSPDLAESGELCIALAIDEDSLCQCRMGMPQTGSADSARIPMRAGIAGTDAVAWEHAETYKNNGCQVSPCTNTPDERGRSFGESCKTGRPPACSGVDGLRALQLVRGIYTSCAEGRTIEIARREFQVPRPNALCYQSVSVPSSLRLIGRYAR